MKNSLFFKNYKNSWILIVVSIMSSVYILLKIMLSCDISYNIVNHMAK